ncbi:MAG: cytochrome P450 [Pseudomonadales bacterium]|nr:cytochrome P450 [Pseudomonadales bacterium]
MKINISPDTFPPDYDYKVQPDNTQLAHFPGTFGLPVIGHGYAIVTDLRGLCQRLDKDYGPISKFNMFGSKGLIIADLDIQQAIFLDKDKNFSNEKAFENTLGRFFSGGLLLIDFDEHKTQRRIFQTAFKNDAMKTYISQMNVIMDKHIQHWQGDNSFRFYPQIKKCLLSTSAKIFIGEEEEAQVQFLNKNFVDMFDGMVGLIQMEIPGTKWHKAKRALRNLRSHYQSLIPARREDNTGTDFLTYLSQETKEDGGVFSDDEIVDHINFLLMAAHDTTTSALTNIVMELAKNPQWQERLRQQAFVLDKPFLDYSDLENMPDFDHVMLEAQRLYPSVPISWRRSIRDCDIDGQHIPANTTIWSPMLLHYRDEKWWSNPDQFDPDRFSAERCEHKKHKFLFVPFGGGAHKCIGMHFANIQVKCFLHQFLRNYRFTVAENYQPRLMIIPMPKPMDNLPLKLERIFPPN